MPKLSISIPDHLWKQVEEREGKQVSSPSQFIQETLRFYLDTTRPPDRFRPQGAGDPKRLQSVVERLKVGYKECWQTGYDDGLTFAEKVGYSFFQSLARRGELRIHADILDGHPEFGYVDLTGKRKTGSDHAWCIDFVERATGEALLAEFDKGDVAYRDGADQALRDLWDVLQRETAAPGSRNSEGKAAN